MPPVKLDSSNPIARHVWNVLEGFESVLAALKGAPVRIQSKVLPGGFRDELGRFRIWSGNIGAHREGRGSLDYKLREASHIRDSIIESLQLATTVLGKALSIISEQTTPWEDVQYPETDSDEGISDVEDDCSPPQTELTQLVSNLVDVNTSLLRLSVSIRNPAPHDQFKGSKKIDVSHFEKNDIEHVRAKFPEAEEFLVLRLGKAISRRRQFLKYREEHRKKYGSGLDKAAAEPLNVPVQIPQGVNDAQSTTTTEFQSTVASSLNNTVKNLGQQAVLDFHEDSDDILSQTSCASSNNETIRLRLPPLPYSGVNDEPFECTLCFRMIQVAQLTSWRRHVFKDLQPYVCTFESCDVPDCTYESRNEWFKHELEAHRGQWECPEGCKEPFHSPDLLRKHLEVTHPNLGTKARVTDLLAMCHRQLPTQSKVKCTLCFEELPSLIQSRRHLGRHLQELSLFALPSSVLQECDEDECASNTKALQSSSALGDSDEYSTNEATLSEHAEDLGTKLEPYPSTLFDNKPPSSLEVWNVVHANGVADALEAHDLWSNLGFDLGFGRGLNSDEVKQIKALYQLHTSNDTTDPIDRNPLEAVRPELKKTLASSLSIDHSSDPALSSEVRHLRTRKSASKLPSQAIKMLNAWLDTNRDHPYPSAETKRALAEACGITIKQVTTWFTNVRQRQLVTLGNDNDTISNTRDQLSHQGSKEIYSRATVPSWEDLDSSRALRREKGEQDRAKTAFYESDGYDEQLGAENWQCTFCRVHLTAKSWRRHEERQHHPKYQWVCLASEPMVTSHNGQKMCVFCGSNDIDADHCERVHRVSDCLQKPEHERTFYRPDHLQQHARNYHRATQALSDLARMSWRRDGPGITDNMSWMCGFCGETLRDWDERAKHVAVHFKAGLDMSSWQDNMPKSTHSGGTKSELDTSSSLTHLDHSLEPLQATTDPLDPFVFGDVPTDTAEPTYTVQGYVLERNSSTPQITVSYKDGSS